MAETAKGIKNKNLIAGLIALVILALVAAVYLDRRGRQNLERYRTHMRGDLLEEWGPGPNRSQQVNSALQATPVAATRQVSYKNAIARIAPSVVSVNVTVSTFMNQSPPLQPQPLAGNAGNQPAGQPQGILGSAQYVRGRGGMGRLSCPNCGTTVPCPVGVASYGVNCPSCGMGMVRQGPAGGYQAPAAARQMAVAPPGAGQGYQFQGPNRGGSGVIVNSRGYVLTNHHVVHGARSITVTLASGQVTKTYPALLVDEAPHLDFAILKIQSKGNEQFPAAVMGNSSEMSVGDEVLALGSPFGLQQTVTFGIVSNTRRTLTVGKTQFTNFLQTDAPINPGSSGGPLVNVKGEVIGINTAIYSPTQAFSGIGFASPIDPAKAAFPDFIELAPNSVARAFMRDAPNWVRGQLTPVGQFPARLRGQGLLPWPPPASSRLRRTASRAGSPWLGIRTRTVDEQVRDWLSLPATRGVAVMEVFGRSPCAAAGLRSGDVILRVDGRRIKDDTMLANILAGKAPAEPMELTVYRDGRRLDLQVTWKNLTAPGQNSPAWQGQLDPTWQRQQNATIQAQAVVL